MHKKRRNFINVEPKSVVSSFIFLPLFFFFILFKYLLFYNSFYNSLSFIFMFISSPSISLSQCSLFYYSFVEIKFLHIFNCSSMYFSIPFRVNSLITSCLLLVILFITGIMNKTEMQSEQEAAINM